MSTRSKKRRYQRMQVSDVLSDLPFFLNGEIEFAELQGRLHVSVDVKPKPVPHYAVTFTDGERTVVYPTRRYSADDEQAMAKIVKHWPGSASADFRPISAKVTGTETRHVDGSVSYQHKGHPPVTLPRGGLGGLAS